MRSLEFPPTDPPAAFQGMVILIRVLADESGIVVRDSVTLAMPIRDRGYESRLRTSIAHDSFRPAVFAGCAVPGHFVLEVAGRRYLH